MLLVENTISAIPESVAYMYIRAQANIVVFMIGARIK